MTARFLARLAPWVAGLGALAALASPASANCYIDDWGRQLCAPPPVYYAPPPVYFPPLGIVVGPRYYGHYGRPYAGHWRGHYGRGHYGHYGRGYYGHGHYGRAGYGYHGRGYPGRHR